METTPVSLLHRLHQTPQSDDWNILIDLCTPLLLSWAKSTGLTDAGAADLVQDVFVVLIEEMPTFKYDPDRSFRSWLKTVTLNKWRTSLRRRKPESLEDFDETLIVGEPSPSFWETEFHQQIAARAMEIIRQRFEPTTWEACRQMTIDGLSAKEVATNLGLTEAAVFKAKSRVLQVLRKELEGMMD